VRHEQGLAWLSRVLTAGALARGEVAMLAQAPTGPRERLWLMRSRLTQRTPLADPAFGWLLAQAAAPGAPA
jgi:DNA-binding transcriptional LysR family regulator